MSNMETIISRKIFGKKISYNLVLEESAISKQLHISVACLQPELFQEMLGNSPELSRNHLLQVATDAAYSFNQGSQLEEPAFVSSNKKDVCMRARFSCR